MNRGSTLPLGGTEVRTRARWLAPTSIAIAALLPAALPVVASVPWLPPLGLLMLLGWRLNRADTLAPWAAAPLGLIDDLVSGQPIGSAMLGWSLCVLAIEVLDSRLMWRDFWQNWLIAAGAIGFVLIGTRLIAAQLGAHVDTALLMQVIVSGALYPLAARFCAALDGKGGRR